MVRSQRGVALDIIDLVDANAELLSNDLPDGDPQPLAEIDLAADTVTVPPPFTARKESTSWGSTRRGAITAPWASASVRTRASAKPTVNAPPLRIVRRLKRCGEINAFMSASLSRRRHDSANHPHMSAAAAKMPVERRANFFLSRLRFFRQQRNIRIAPPAL